MVSCWLIDMRALIILLLNALVLWVGIPGGVSFREKKNKPTAPLLDNHGDPLPPGAVARIANPGSAAKPGAAAKAPGCRKN